MSYAAARVAPEKTDFRPVLLPHLTAGFLPEKTMGHDYEIPDNVNVFMDAAALAYGKIKDSEFNQLMWSDCRRIQSPIEQLFYIAIHLVCHENLVEPQVCKQFSEDNDNLQIIHQWPVGNYFADFAIRQHPIGKIICVELDGHQFHDRNEKQRRYEKQRDRFFLKKNYKVLHFTGSEVVKDPCAVAIEVLVAATNLEEVVTHPFEDR